MSADKPELFASVKRLIRERNEIEQALPLVKSTFGEWSKKKKKKRKPTRLADCDVAITHLIRCDDAE